MSREDLPFADAVRADAGWNQTLTDWNRFLLHQPEGCFIAEESGQPVGTATTWIHGPHLAWIGMVLVRTDARGHGIGTALLRYSIRFLQERGIRGIRLDATPLGRPVYERLGFKAEWELHRWEHPNWPGSSIADKDRSTELSRIRPWRPTDTQAESPLLVLERLAFGTPRAQLIEALSQSSLRAVVLVEPTDTVAAFGMIRAGSRATYLGPAVAQDPASAEPLLESLLQSPTGTPLFWDIPEPNWPARAWAERHGFRRQRVLTRMYLGTSEPVGNPHLQLALSGPETG